LGTSKLCTVREVPFFILFRDEFLKNDFLVT